MRGLLALVKCLWPVLCVSLFAHANSEQTANSDCKALISHSGFAEFVMPSEGGTHRLAIKAGASVKWTISNGDYVDWIEILDGNSGVGPGSMTIRLEANTGRLCRVGVLTIVGPQLIFGAPMRIGSPIRILQRGTEPAGVKDQAKPPSPVINLAPFTSNSAQPPPRKSRYKTIVKK